MNRHRHSILPLTVALISAVALTPVTASAFQPANFNRDIRPILAENCFYCHGQDAAKRQAELRFDLRDSAISRGAVVPRNPDASTLIERIHSTDPDSVMPPPDSGRLLSDQQKQLLRQWISAGAEYEPHWAFTTPVRPAEPPVRNAAWPRNPIDRFVLAELERTGLQPSPEADRPTLIRRLAIDLVIRNTTAPPAA